MSNSEKSEETQISHLNNKDMGKTVFRTCVPQVKNNFYDLKTRQKPTETWILKINFVQR